MKPISKSEAKVIKKRINTILENFDVFTRHQLSQKLKSLAKFVNPINISVAQLENAE